MLPGSRSLRTAVPRGTSLLIGVVLLSAAAAPAALATTITWNNASGGSWSNASNWSPANVPDAAGETAVLPTLGSAYQVTLDVHPGCDAAEIDAGATLDLNGYSVAGVGTIDNYGTLLQVRGVYSSGKYHNHAGGVVRVAAADSIITVDSVIDNDGSIVIGPASSTALHLYATMSFHGTGEVVLDGGRIASDFGYSLPYYSLGNGDGHTIRGAGVINAYLYNHGVFHGDTSPGEILLNGLLYNYNTTRVSNGGAIRVNRPLVKNTGGQIVGGSGGGSFEVLMPYGVTGTIDCSEGGTLVGDGGALNVRCGMLVNCVIQQTGGSGIVNLVAATPQDLVVPSGAELGITGFVDFMQSHSRFINDGIVRVSGQLNVGGYAPDSMTILGTGEMILEGGTLASMQTGTLVNGATHTISGCGDISAYFVNLGTVTVDCGGLSMFLEGAPKTNLGTIQVRRGILRVMGEGTRVMNAGGRIKISAGQAWIDHGATIYNAGGTFTADGGQVFLGLSTTAKIVGGRLDAANGGFYRNFKSITLENVTLGPSAVLVTESGGTTHATGASLIQQGLNRIKAGGAFVMDPGTDFIQTGGETVLEGGTLTAAHPAQIQGGTLRGIGTITADVTNGASVVPDVAGTIAIHGNYHQLAGGRLEVGLAGFGASQVSRLDVAGNAVLDGSLAIATAESFDPGVGHDFQILACDALSGVFQSCAGVESNMKAIALYGSNGVAVQVNPGVLAAGDRLPRALRFYGRYDARGAGLALELPKAATVRIRAFDVSGREVATLVNDRREAGTHVFALTGAGATTRLPSGVYFARLEIGGETREVRTARVVLAR